MKRLPEPPDESKWDELGISEHCTCNKYAWETTCPYVEELYPEKDNSCDCCPYCSLECFRDI